MSFNVYASTSSTGTFTKIQSGIEANEVNLASRSAGPNYFKVSETNVSGEGPQSASVGVTVIAGAAVPSYVNGAGSVTINMAMPAYATDITLQYATVDPVTGPWADLGTGTATSQSLAKFADTRYFRVFGVGANATGAVSPTLAYVHPTISAPVLTVTQNGTSANLSWTAIDNALSYTVYINGAYSTQTTGLTHTVTNVTTATTFTILAVAGFAQTSSNAVNYVPITPIPPTGFTATKSGSNIVLNWTRPAGFTPSLYHLYYSIDGGGRAGPIIIDGAATSYTFTPSGDGAYKFDIYSLYQGWGGSTFVTTSIQFTSNRTFVFTATGYWVEQMSPVYRLELWEITGDPIYFNIPNRVELISLTAETFGLGEVDLSYSGIAYTKSGSPYGHQFNVGEAPLIVDNMINLHAGYSGDIIQGWVDANMIEIDASIPTGAMFTLTYREL